MIKSITECFAIQQGIINIRVFDCKNLPVRDFSEDVISGALVVPASCEKRYVMVVLESLKGAVRDSTYGKLI